MYDTINMRLFADECKGVNFVEDLPRCLTSARVNANTATGELWLDGRLGNMKITANRYIMQIRDGSLCKWYFGDNFHTLDQDSTRTAIEMLSDTLHLPLSLASITRLDVATNLIMDKPPEVYFEHLGALRYAHRLAEPSGLYYTTKSKAYRLAFYDKGQEYSEKREAIPEPYKDCNVLRYEQRYCKRIAQRLQRPELRAAALYDATTHRELVSRWLSTYNEIRKVNDIKLNTKMFGTIKDFNRLGILSLVERVGGQNEMLAQIAEARKSGEITSKTAYDLRAKVRDACKVDGEVVIQSEAVREMDSKVREAAALYM